MYYLLLILLIPFFSLLISSIHHLSNLKGHEHITMKYMGLYGCSFNSQLTRIILRITRLYTFGMYNDAHARYAVQRATLPMSEALEALALPALPETATTTLPSVSGSGAIHTIPHHTQIAFFGDSTFNYWNTLERDIPNSFNASFGGSRSQDLLEYVEQLCFVWSPKIIIIHVGGNDWDMNDTFYTYQNIILLIRKCHSMNIFVILFFSPRAPIYSNEKWLFLSQLREKLLQTKNIYSINLSNLLLPRNFYITDGVHFSSKGYKFITRAILNCL